MNRLSSFVLAAGRCVFHAQVQSTPEPPRPTRFALELRGGWLSLDAEDVPLGKLVQSLETWTAISASFHDPSIERSPVTVHFRDMSLEESIRDLLQGRSYVIAKPRRAARLSVAVLESAGRDEMPKTAARVMQRPDTIAPDDYEPPSVDELAAIHSMLPGSQAYHARDLARQVRSALEVGMTGSIVPAASFERESTDSFRCNSCGSRTRRRALP